MDKYTVDLDQLLNDFEYAELTDQQSKNVQLNNMPKRTAESHPEPHLKASCNGSQTALDNKVDCNGVNEEESASAVAELVADIAKQDEEESVVDDGIDTANAEDKTERVDAEPPPVGLSKTEQDNSEISDYCDSAVNTKADSLVEERSQGVKEPQEVLVQIDEDVDNVTTEFFQSPDSQLHEENNDINKDQVKIKEEAASSLILESIDTNTLEELKVNNGSFSTDLSENDETMKNEEEHHPDLSKANVSEGTLVSLSADLDIDDIEKNKVNFPTPNDTKILEEVSFVSSTTTDPGIHENEKTMKEECLTLEATECNVNISSDTDIDEKATMKSKEDDMDTNDSEESKVNFAKFSVDLDIDENELNKMLEDLELEETAADCKEEVVAPTSDEAKTPHENNVEETVNEKCQEVLEEVKGEAVSVEEAPQEQLSHQASSQEPPARPQDLPLNNQVPAESAGRKINLIGSPGSTPYNNVYINKSIDSTASKPAEDSDCTSSASPTFSDRSTESISTASTVSVEDVPNDTDKFTKKNNHVKNTNIEDENSRRSQEMQGASGGENDGDNSEEVEGEESRRPENDEQQAAGDSVLTVPQQTLSDKSRIGKAAPVWIPDSDAASCLHCDMKFTVIKRRHHCRACGLVLCSKCCNLKTRLEYLDAEARVCNKCFIILNSESGGAASDQNSADSSPAFRPNPNNPLEYCSTVSPLQQVGQGGAPHPPTVMVPVGVLKRKGSNKKTNKSVMFCDGIAPGSDLTILDQDFNYSAGAEPKLSGAISVQQPDDTVVKKSQVEDVPPVKSKKQLLAAAVPKMGTRNQPRVDSATGSFIPKNETSLPPTVTIHKTEILYSDCSNSPSVVEMLKNEALIFAIHPNLLVHVKIINMSCCIDKQAWCFCSEGLINVGSDEIVYLIEYIDEESFVPKDVFFHIQNVYTDALKGTSVKELGISLHNTSNFLDSRNHAGFVYIKPTFQCLENVIVPKEPYLVGILIHRWETPWAKLFPLRLILRLGADYKYYPSPLISTRHRDSVFVEIGHTIINLLADFRNFTYTLPQIRGLVIHMEDKNTTITIPRNRYDQVMKSINNSSEHILAFAGNFSSEADSHLVCIQDTAGHENSYTTHAINIHHKPRKVTGASFIVFNGSLKSSSGLTAKSNIVEDGLMIQIPAERMDKIREDLRNMDNHEIACGCVNATSDETVNITWGEDDVNFNEGVKSPVDSMDMKGVPSIRVHNGHDFVCSNGTKLIRWTEVFILQNAEENPRNQDPVDISKVSKSISKACCAALVKYLDLLVTNGCTKVAVRATLQVDNVSYLAGSNGSKLAPIYMLSLDNELIPVLHRITSNSLGDNAVVVELIFRILNA